MAFRAEAPILRGTHDDAWPVRASSCLTFSCHLRLSHSQLGALCEITYRENSRHSEGLKFDLHLACEGTLQVVGLNEKLPAIYLKKGLDFASGCNVLY